MYRNSRVPSKQTQIFFHTTNTSLQLQLFSIHQNPNISISINLMVYFLGMKRGREGEFDTTMANCLMLLSRSSGGAEFNSAANSPGRVFECKTCSRQFPSFQALGGHRASHKRPRLMGGGGDLNHHTGQLQSSPPKPKTHECSICGLEFAIGQALGGHMRRHRAVAAAAAVSENRPPELSLSPSQQEAPVVKKSNSRRVSCLDLNLTPGENGLDFQLEKVAPMLHCYL